MGYFTVLISAENLGSARLELKLTDGFYGTTDRRTPSTIFRFTTNQPSMFTIIFVHKNLQIAVNGQDVAGNSVLTRTFVSAMILAP